MEERTSGAPGQLYPWAVTLLLMLCATWSFVDKHLFSLLIQPIKASLGISDSQIGLIQSVSFSLFMLLATFPLARIADRGSRPRLIGWCIAAWSVMTMSCGLATHWVHLLLARTGVAVGEAGLPPAALSYLADVHKPRNLPRANAIYLLGPFLGGGLAMLVGGRLYAAAAWDLSAWPILRDLERWQLLFMIIGAPGFLLSALVFIFLREDEVRPRMPRSATRWPELRAFLLRVRWFFILYTLAIGMTHFVYNAHVVWLPSALIRGFGLAIGEAGQIAGLIYLIAGISGAFTSAWLVGRAGEGRLLQAALRLMLINAILLLPAAIGAPLAPTLTTCICLFSAAIFLTSSLFGVSTLAIQLIAPSSIRASAISIHSIFVIIIGPGFGPLVAGMLSDSLGSLFLALAIIGLVAISILILMLVLAARLLPAQAPAAPSR
jgi:MFS family permease